MTALMVITAAIVVGSVSTRAIRFARRRRRNRRVAHARAELLECVDEIVDRAESLEELVESLGQQGTTDAGVWNAIGAHHDWLLRTTRLVHRGTNAAGVRRCTYDLEHLLLRFDLEVCRSRSLVLRRPAPDDDRCKLAIIAVHDRSSALLEVARFTRIVAHTEL